MEKKKHPGRTAVLVILGVIILIPALAFAYLSFMGFGADKMRAQYDAAAPYEGTTVFNADGTASFSLARDDLFYLIDEFELEKDAAEALSFVTDALSIKAIAADAGEDGLCIYADAVAFGFIPVPLKAVCSVTLPREGKTVTVKLTSAYLGKWIKLPLDKLGIDGEYEAELSKLGAPLTDISFSQGAITLTERFLSEYFVYPANDLSELARVIAMYEPEGGYEGDPLVALCADTAGLSNEELFAYVAEQEDGRAALTGLIALCTDAVASKLGSGLAPYEKRFIYPCESAGIETARSAFYAMPADGQRRYQSLIDTLREKYKAFELKLDTSSFIDAATGAELSLSELDGMDWADDAASRVALLYSFDAAYAVKTADMPNLADVPNTGRKALKDINTAVLYDVGLVTRMPSGMPAVIYYVAKGYFVINEISEEEYSGFMTDERLPVILTDELPKPPTRTNYPAPAEDLAEYTVLFRQLKRGLEGVG